MAPGAYHPSVTPTLLLCLGDFGERVAQTLIPDIRAAGPPVEAAVRWLRVTWPEAGSVRLTDSASQVLLETNEDDPDRFVSIRDNVAEALRGIGSHATRERLVRAGRGLPDDSPTGRWMRCYLIAALGEAPVAAALAPLLAHVSTLLSPRHSPQSVAAFLSIATHSLDPDAPQRAAVTTALQTLLELVTGESIPGLWPCVLLDWVKSGGVFAEGDDELSAALAALLRVLLLADEPAALLQEAFPKAPPVAGETSAFCSLGVAVIQNPPPEAVLEWLTAHLMAEFLSRRCLDPLEGPQEITLSSNSHQLASRLHLLALLESLTEGLDAEVTAEPGLIVSMPQETFDQWPKITEAMIVRESRLLLDQVRRNHSALKTHLLSENDPVGQIPSALAEELNRGPHGLLGAEILLKAIAEQVQGGQAVLARKLARWPLRHERLAEQVRQTQAALSAVRRTSPSPNALLFRSGLLAVLWGTLFGTWAGGVWGAGKLAGAVLTAVAVVIAIGLWYVFLKLRQIKRAQRDYITAVAALQSAQVETALLEAAQAVLATTHTWRERQAERLQATRTLLEDVHSLLVAPPLHLPSNPIIIETLPYLDGYASWLQSVLHDDPLMLEVQRALERNQVLANWPDSNPMALLQAFIEAGRHVLEDVPELSVEDALTSQGKDTLEFHLDRLHRLATPLINLNQPVLSSPSGAPSTLDIVCWEQGSITRLRGWLENHLPDCAAIAATDDPQRVTYIRMVPGFDLESLGDGKQAGARR